ncbi:hypothetical protein [Actinocrispum sp. NPDC049592]|uniref:hypothetical protein n=1 Tax=Actinocrispum sp. NPDC049592 TaxID=3154835 RepID=UPI00341E082D
MTYFIWLPRVLDTAPPSVELFLTYGDLEEIFDGTDEMIEEVLADVGVDDKILSWSLTRYRSGYFDGNYDGENWEERWPLAVRLGVELSDKPWLDEVPPWGYIETEAVDYEPPDSFMRMAWPPTPCLVLANFTGRSALNQAWTQVSAMVPEATFSTITVADESTQLRIDLGERDYDFYSGGAQLAVEVENLCSHHGGRIRG